MNIWTLSRFLVNPGGFLRDRVERRNLGEDNGLLNLQVLLIRKIFRCLGGGTV